MNGLVTFSISLTIFLILQGCQYDYIVFPGDDHANDDDLFQSTCNPDTVYFKNTIQPLVVSSCGTSGCHDASSHADGIILIDYASILQTGKIKPGNPNDSEFFEVLTDSEDDLMPPPPFAPLDQNQIDLIRSWIAQGALNNACTDGCDTTRTGFSGIIWPMMQSYCTGCHTSGSPGGGIVIEGYSDLVRIAKNGSLMGSVRHESGYAPMPPNTVLSPCKTDQLQKWIDQGMPDN